MAVSDKGRFEIKEQTKESLRVFPKGFDHWRAHGNVGHEVAVHHIEVEVVCPGINHTLTLISEARHVGSQQRGTDAATALMVMHPKILQLKMLLKCYEEDAIRDCQIESIQTRRDITVRHITTP